jgi:hypothetical protein
MASSFPKEYEDTFNRILKNDLEDRFTSSGMASGETLKNIESLIGKRARDYSMSPDPDHRQIGAALNEVKSSLRDMLERQNPAHAGDLRNINQAYASLERMAHATKSAGAQKKGGVFSPEEYLAAVKSADSSLRKRNVAKGTAMDQDFAQAAQRVLGKGQSGIGSAYRTAGAIGLGGAYMANPSILAAEIGASIPYSPIGQRLTSQVIGRRPEMLRAPVLRSSVKAATPMVAPAIISPLQQLRDTNPEQIYRSTTE